MKKNKKRGIIIKNMLPKKRIGQSALEFLLTYGWALTIIIIAIVILSYYGLFDIKTYMTDYCSFGPQLECGDFEITTNNAQFFVRNNYGFPIKIEKISVIQKGKILANYTPTDETLGHCFSEEGEDHIDECEAIEDKDTCNTNDACTWIGGSINVDEGVLIDLSSWNSTSDTGGLNFIPNKKDEVGFVIYFRRIDPAEATTQNPLHKIKGIIFTKIRKESSGSGGGFGSSPTNPT